MSCWVVRCIIVDRTVTSLCVWSMKVRIGAAHNLCPLNSLSLVEIQFTYKNVSGSAQLKVYGEQKIASYQPDSL